MILAAQLKLLDRVIQSRQKKVTEDVRKNEGTGKKLQLLICPFCKN
jgi:hypothetical protein